VQARPKRFEYEVSIDRDGRAHAEEGPPLELDEAWTPEHLLLAGLARCTLKSLVYHARRAGISVSAAGTVVGTVTRREDDGRYALVEADCKLDVELDPPPGDDALAKLLAKAERDCFVGASLRASPRYEWRVNGRPVR
jgi:organic hydroperoxide reductase OsmC/OhrA